jgi:hypothetical protein
MVRRLTFEYTTLVSSLLTAMTLCSVIGLILRAHCGPLLDERLSVCFCPFYILSIPANDFAGVYTVKF